MANRPVSFALHIRTLFTVSQTQCMSRMIRLNDYNDMKANAERVFARLADESMPADSSRPWPDEWIALFRRWIDEGTAP